jgi:hypothetical protein
MCTLTSTRCVLTRMSGLALAAVVLVFALSTTGCGGSGNGVSEKSPAQIVAATQAAALGASAVRVTSSSSVSALHSHTALDMAYSGNGAQGKLTVVALSCELIRVGDTLYVRGNSAFRDQLVVSLGGQLGKAVAKTPSGTWLKTSVNGPLAQLAAVTDMHAELPVLIGRGTPVAKGPETTVNGQQAITIKQVGKLFRGTLSVASNGTPYPLQLLKNGRENAQTVFSGWNQPATIEPPANAVELSQLAHQGG